MKNQIKYATIVPLIGGLTVASKQVIGVDPVALLSYTPFAGNDTNARHHFKDVPYFQLDNPDSGFEPTKYQNLDFINAVCPCAGLSMLSTGSHEQRQTMNHWMLESAKYVTGTLKPKVFWGENAPGLYSKFGTHVREQLRDIGKANGYTFSVYSTNTLLHGIPQSRKRTFYFFWQNDKTPILSYYDREKKNLADYLAEVPYGISGQTDSDIVKAQENVNSLSAFQFLQDKYQGEGIKAFRDWEIKGERQQLSVLVYLIESKQIYEARDYFIAKGAGHEITAKYFSRICAKVDNNEGYWDGTISKFRPDGHFGALISRNLVAMHPTEDRSITPRECMHLMALPHDFELVTGELNHICQNVPVCTGADMTREVVAYLDGERDLIRSTYILQSNNTGRIDYKDSTLME
jgi:site-specific DNA-cytosine methylase